MREAVEPVPMLPADSVRLLTELPVIVAVPDCERMPMMTEEVELALVRLARETGNFSYMGLAKFFVDERGQSPNFFVEEAIAQGRASKGVAVNKLEYNHAHPPHGDKAKVVVLREGKEVEAEVMF